jgi:KWG leptospira repeat protein
MINIEGKEILPCEYDDLYSLKNTDNSILIEKDGKIGLVDSTGKVIIEPQYKEIRGLGTDYKLGYITITEDDKYGVVDCNNQKVLENKYQDIKSLTENGIYAVKENNNWELVQRNGELKLSEGLQNVQDILGIKNGNIIIKNTSNKVGVISSEGETILNTVYDDVKFAFTGSYIIEQNGKYGIAKSKDEIVVNPTYTTMNYISTADIIEASEDGITSNLLNSNFEIKLTGIVTEINTNKGYIKIRQDNEEKYYNFRFEERTKQDINSSNTLFLDKQNDKYGYVDKNGKVVVDYQYDDATEQNEYGYAAVQKDGKWGAINEKGEEIVAPQYDFSNNLGIDFIGEWHLGSIDSNATYYTK